MVFYDKVCAIIYLMIELTQASHVDEAFLYALYVGTRVDELRQWGWDEMTQQQFLRMQWTAQQRAYAMQFPESEHSIIHYRRLRAGRMIVDRTAHEIMLVDIALLPEYRGQGIGSALIRKLQQEAASSSVPLRLSVLSANPARSLYARLGFEETADNGMHTRMEWRNAH